MEGIYPLIVDASEVGRVTVRADGGWTVFDVRATALEGIVRVSVYGEGREGYLGVLAPEGDGLCLRRRLSRSAMREFPAQIEFAGRAGLPCAPAPEPETEPEAIPEGEPVPLPEPAPEPTPEQKPEPEQQAARESETPPDIEDDYWFASPDGALVCFDGERNLIALPVGDPRIPGGGGGWPRTIEGRAYIVYRTKDGKLVH